MEINKTWLSGLVISRPVLAKLSSKTMSASFELQVNEQFVNRDGVTQVRPSIFTIESLGRSAETTAQKVLQGSRYTVDGYLRQEKNENGSIIKVRTFAVYADESTDAFAHKDGLKTALEILSKAKDKESAVRAIEDLLK